MKYTDKIKARLWPPKEEPVELPETVEVVPVEETILKVSRELEDLKLARLRAGTRFTTLLVSYSVGYGYHSETNLLPKRLTQHLAEILDYEIELCEQELKDVMMCLCEEK